MLAKLTPLIIYSQEKAGRRIRELPAGFSVSTSRQGQTRSLSERANPLETLFSSVRLRIRFRLVDFLKPLQTLTEPVGKQGKLFRIRLNLNERIEFLKSFNIIGVMAIFTTTMFSAKMPDSRSSARFV